VLSVSSLPPAGKFDRDMGLGLIRVNAFLGATQEDRFAGSWAEPQDAIDRHQ